MLELFFGLKMQKFARFVTGLSVGFAVCFVISLLGIRSMNVNELAEALSLPVSTAALNVRQLEEAGLISTEIQPGIRGAMKLCSRRIDSVSMRLTDDMLDGMSALTLQLLEQLLGAAAHPRGFLQHRACFLIEFFGGFLQLNLRHSTLAPPDSLSSENFIVS